LLAERAIAVVVEIAGENDLALLELRSIHRLSSGTFIRPENGRHRLKISVPHGDQKLIDGELWGRSSSELTVVGNGLGCSGTRGEKKQTSNFSERHYRFLHEMGLAT
jgi:hypothetical protein